MARKLRVWGGMVQVPSGQARVIVAEYTKKAGYASLYGIYPGTSRYYFDHWWAETSNATELKIACEPGVWIKFADNDYRRLSERCPECGGNCRGPKCSAPPEVGDVEYPDA